MRREVEQPRLVLEAKLGIVPDSYAYVGGGFDATLRRLVREAGYTTARSILHGRIQDPEHRYAMRVVRIGSGLDVVDQVADTHRPGLPGFTRLMLGGDGG
jgi:peptidoglycan/xylan/chitin deacetylase (PgdA/CDA1 family)